MIIIEPYKGTKAVLVISDMLWGLHTEKHIHNYFSEAKMLISNTGSDVEYIMCCGNWSILQNNFSKVCNIIRKLFPQARLLSTVGTYDLNWFKGPIEGRVKEFDKLLRQYDISLLDGLQKPVMIGNNAFVGGIGWYDGCALTNHQCHTMPKPQYWLKTLHNKEEIMYNANYATLCREQLIKKIEASSEAESINVITHFPAFYRQLEIKQANDDLFHYHPTLGFEILKYEKVKRVFSGHLRRLNIKKIKRINGQCLYNIITTFRFDKQNSYCAVTALCP